MNTLGISQENVVGFNEWIKFQYIKVGFDGAGDSEYVGGDRKLFIVIRLLLESGAMRTPKFGFGRLLIVSRISRIVKSSYMFVSSTTISIVEFCSAPRGRADPTSSQNQKCSGTLRTRP
jgi:hypothetical protein